MQLIAWLIVARALYVGIADLYVARTVSDTPKARWVLVVQGLFGVAVGLAVLFGGQYGRAFFGFIIGGYFTIAGLSSIGYAVANRMAVRRRVRAAIAEERRVEVAQRG